MPRFLYSPEHPDPDSNYIGIVVIEYEFVGDLVEKHQHKKGHWSFVMEGEIEYTVGERVFDAAAPTQVWIPKNTDHSMRSKTARARSQCIMPRDA